MDTFFRFPKVEAVPFGSIDNGGEEDFLKVFFFQSLLDIMVVVRP